MTKKVMDELRNMPTEDLIKRLNELKLELFKARTQLSMGGPPEKALPVKSIRKNIARVLTVLRERGLKY
uniref:Large ribosomal subunit protein uL29 n=1 Tax=uncultured korarchaeote TaxID=161241 RepID=A0A1L2JJY5_9CREN|nr:ribosomal protein L29 [uncultured korarchaeote]